MDGGTCSVAQSCNVTPRTKHSGLVRGREIEKVLHSYKSKDWVMFFVTWKRSYLVGAVSSEEIKHVYPKLIIDYIKSLKLND
ncbi:heterochromatin protein 1D3 chromoshadow domain [Drosophila erecta]|uniref:Heterochromatin protein 1D3 chromoshadow domain n=1 Tax=Drosophila erecta TaxID=7220 RepID=B3NUS6_DROER|nr:heterochromatin protein 1D3 chromoshadow domain [Drosophila erecta]